ncbi:MAG: molybdopterin-dependent oxidoreductase [Caldiserica bacterium]|nr:molybdopterin-dependent oxidoreductase [Caldisericota bacterium]MDH7562222.1 molybdopterin-dependent oxidoreductase [Caldisericota bacterium]
MKERIPPGQRLSEKLIPLHIEDPIPRIPREIWYLEVKGLVQNPFRWTLKEFLEISRDSLSGDFHCVTGWSTLNLKWEGMLFKNLLEIVKPDPRANFVLFEAVSEYTTGLSLEYLMKEPSIIAHSLQGKPIPLENGGPLRLVVPGKYAYKSLKWLVTIRFLDREVLGYWEERGYSNSADPWKEERFS